jgi:CheY-like chemotaxis protein
LGFSKLLIEPETDEELKKECLSRLETSSNRLINTINDYIDISLIASGNIVTYFENININHQITGLYEYYEPECRLKNLRFIITLPADQSKTYVLTDPDLLNKILIQLIGNAIKFTEKGSINIGYSMQDGQPVFFVKDTGIGISKEFFGLIYDPFRQEETSASRQYEGNGLGLAIAKGLVELLGGKIWCESQKGKGSEFYFTIPVKPGKKPVSSFSAGKAPMNSSKRPVILVAEDDMASYVYIKSALLQLRDIEVIHVLNGLQAVSACRERTDIGLVIMDIKMPVMDGYEATRQIRTFNKSLPIIAMTAYALNNDKVKCFEAGCTGFIPKPLQKEQILSLLVNQLL